LVNQKDGQIKTRENFGGEKKPARESKRLEKNL